MPAYRGVISEQLHLSGVMCPFYEKDFLKSLQHRKKEIVFLFLLDLKIYQGSIKIAHANLGLNF